jgi:hypothetical protein
MDNVRVRKVVTRKIRLRAHKEDHENMLCDGNNPRICRWNVAVHREVPGATKVWVDAGHIKLTLDGWRWEGDTPKQIKADLIQLDKWLHLPRAKRTLTPPPFEGGTFVVTLLRKKRARKATQADLEKMSRRRYARIADGNPDKPHKKYTFHDRVVGFA